MRRRYQNFRTFYFHLCILMLTLSASAGCQAPAPQQADTEEFADDSSLNENCSGDCGSGTSAYGTVVGTYRGVPAYSNGSTHGCHDCKDGTALGLTTCGARCGQGTSSVQTRFGLAYQCVEYVRRFYDAVYQDQQLSQTYGDAKTYAQTLPKIGFNCYKNKSTVAPQPDDILVFDGGAHGHIAIIRAVSDTSVKIIQQNNVNSDEDGNCSIALDGTGGKYSLGSPACHLSGFELSWCRRPGFDWKTCAANHPCPDGYSCFDGVCKSANTPSCTNGKVDGDETDRDCGGGTCPKCATGLNCQRNTDCVSGVCTTGVCSTTPTLSWQKVPSATSKNLLAAWGAKANDIWASGDEGTVLHWNGSSWSGQTIALNYLTHLWGASSTDVWSTSGDGTMYHWNGSAWSAQGRVMQATTQWGIWGSSASDIWTVGNLGTVQHWNGSSWSSSQPGGMRALRAVWGSGRDDVWVVGVGSPSNIIHWNGSSWTNEISGTNNGLMGIWGTSSNDLWAVGSGFILHNTGNGWTAIPGAEGKSLQGVWGSSRDDVWAVGLEGIILHWDGNMWTSVPSGTTEHLNGIWGTSKNDIWVVGNAGVILHYGP